MLVSLGPICKSCSKNSSISRRTLPLRTGPSVSRNPSYLGSVRRKDPDVAFGADTVKRAVVNAVMRIAAYPEVSLTYVQGIPNRIGITASAQTAATGRSDRGVNGVRSHSLNLTYSGRAANGIRSQAMNFANPRTV